MFTRSISSRFKKTLAPIAVVAILSSNVSPAVRSTHAAANYYTSSSITNPPVANDDLENNNVDEDSSDNELLVLANDTVEAGGTLSITAVTQGEYGQVAISSTSTSVTYTPNPNYYGYDQFEYTVSDGNGGTDTARVAVWVNSTNDDPVAVDDEFTTIEDSGGIEINVLANDHSGVDDSNETLRIAQALPPVNGTVQENFDGTLLTYTPNPDFSGIDTFTYRISDSDDGDATATVTIYVNGVEDAPVAVDDQVSTKKNTGLSIKVLANDSDPDQDLLTVVKTTKPANGNVNINKDGSIKYTPKRNYTGTDTFTYTMSDGNGGVATATVTVIIQ